MDVPAFRRSSAFCLDVGGAKSEYLHILLSGQKMKP